MALRRNQGAHRRIFDDSGQVEAEAIEWAKRVPFDPNGASATTGGIGEIEVRQVFEDADFSADLYPSEAVRG